MTERTLSENMDGWPEDPYALFGLERSADERELRKAYHRLIKQFKPEHYPDQFRRLNQSYESLKLYLKYRSPKFEPQAHESDPVGGFEADWPVTHSRAAREIEEDSPAQAREIASVWKQAAGDPASDSLSELTQRLVQSPLDEELVLRTFWVARLGTDSASARPLEILEAYLHRAGLVGRVFQLYLMELERVTRATTTDSARDLLRASVADPRLTELTRTVWFGCRRLRETSLIVGDLAALRPELAYDSPAIWKQLLLQAAEILALHGLTRDDESLAGILEEIRACDFELDDDWFDRRWEMVDHLVFRTNQSVHRPPQLYEFVKQTMLRDDGDLKRRFQERVAGWKDEGEALQLLDSFQKSSPVALYLLMRYAQRNRDNYPHQSQENYNRNLQPRVRDFFRLYEDEPYETFRPEAARFCAAEDIPVEDLLNLGLQEASSQPNAARWFTDQNVRLLNDDLPLKCLVACYRAMLD